MLDKVLVSFSENIGRNTKNPFLGSLVLIWVIRNWSILYAAFAFEKGLTIQSKIDFLNQRICANTFWEIAGQFGINVGLAVLLLVVIYFLINGTRAITNLFENRLTPWIYELTAPDKIVLKKEYDRLNVRIEQLGEKIKKERDERLKAQSDVDALEERLKENLERPSEQPQASQSEKSNSPLIDDLETGFSNEDVSYTLNLAKNHNPVRPETKYEAIGLKLFELGYFYNKRESDKGNNYELTNAGEQLMSQIDESLRSSAKDSKPDQKEKSNIEQKLIDKTLEEIEIDDLRDVLDEILNGNGFEYASYQYDVAKVLNRRNFITFLSSEEGIYSYEVTPLGNRLLEKL
ncbi:MAG: hypothetical protein ABJP45_09590 [Cyclobacteriaceae bacterium]